MTNQEIADRRTHVMAMMFLQALVAARLTEQESLCKRYPQYATQTETGPAGMLSDLAIWRYLKPITDKIYEDAQHPIVLISGCLLGSPQEFVRSGILRGFPDFLKSDVFSVGHSHALRFQ